MAESIYLYYSNNDFLLNHAVEDKIKELNVDPFNIVKYDLLENPYDDVLEDLQTVSFFAEKKVIVVRNIQELEKADEYLLQSYLNYFEKPNPDVVVIVVMNELLPESSALGAAIVTRSPMMP
jgi:DNA polymerase-3 subunit delta